MTMQTGEDEKSLRKIMDMTRMLGIVVLLLHGYYYCYGAFREWHLIAPIGDWILIKIEHTGLFAHFHTSKLIALGCLALSLIGIRGRKSEKVNYRMALAYLVAGIGLYFTSGLLLYISAPLTVIAGLYFCVTGLGFILIISGGAILTRIIKGKLSPNVFNTDNETFPQEERLIQNAYSINLPAQYQLKGKTRSSWVNYINPRRSLLIMGSPGSGKSWYIIEPAIKQLIEKQFAAFIFDYKYPDLTLVAYNHFLKCRHFYPIPPAFYSVNYTNPEYSHRNNPLFPEMMTELMHAMDASKTMLLSINRSWAAKQGEFFVESPINFLAAVFWFLRKFQDGQYCTLPHAIELIQLKYDDLFTVLNLEPEIRHLLTPFISAYLEDNMETLDSQIASVRIPLGRLASPLLYYILSGNDFTLDINNPQAPKIVCLGSDPLKSEALAPIISLFCDRLHKIVNQKGKAKCTLIYDEFSSIRVPSIQAVIAVGRGHDIVPIIAIQDYSQLKKVYSKEEAEAIFNMTGNFISGQVSGESAKLISERFPKIMQDRESISINSSDTSISRSKQLEASVPPSTIASLSSGEFVGMMADNPDELIDLKVFHARIVNDPIALKKEKDAYLPLPPVRKVDQASIQANYEQIKQDVQDIVESVMEEVQNDPAKEHVLVKK
jgi:YWFCY protein/Type IV secretory system Conjugative DNA transfer